MVLVVLRILNTHLCCVDSLISLSSRLFLWFLICGLVQVSFLSLYLIFNISMAIFLITLRLDLFSGAYLNKLLFLPCPVTEHSSI